MVINMANNRYELNKELAQMLKGGVIMDVTTPEQARIAQEAGACAVMALERIPALLQLWYPPFHYPLKSQAPHIRCRSVLL